MEPIETVVRARLRGLRTALGLSLDELGARAGLSPSTLSRIETGRRTIGLDVLVPLARALQVDLEALLAQDDDEDVVIRPVRSAGPHRTTWALSRPTDPIQVLKLRLEPVEGPVEQRVHPGHDWFHVLSGRVRLHLGDRDVEVLSGEAAEFATMTPHAVRAVGGPAELIMVFDREGHRAHLHHGDGPPAR